MPSMTLAAQPACQARWILPWPNVSRGERHATSRDDCHDLPAQICRAGQQVLPPAGGRGGTLTCWPRMARTANSNPSHPPGARSPGRCATKGASSGSRERCASMVSMSAPRSKSRRTRVTIAGRDRTPGKRIVTPRLCRSGRCMTSDDSDRAVDLNRTSIDFRSPRLQRQGSPAACRYASMESQS